MGGRGGLHQEAAGEPSSTIPRGRPPAEVLILFAETNGPTMFARIGIMRALDRA